MNRTIRALSPQVGLAAVVALSISTLWMDARHARPVIERWLAEREAPPAQLLSEIRVTVFDNPNISIETAGGEQLSLAATGGRVRIATMFYAHCPTLCPLAVDALQRIDHSLSVSERARLSVLMLSLDPARDAPEVMRQFGSERGLDANRYLLARTQPQDVGRVSRSLHISYSDDASRGLIDHSPVLVLLDAKGREISRTERVAGVDESFLTAVRGALAAKDRA